MKLESFTIPYLKKVLTRGMTIVGIHIIYLSSLHSQIFLPPININNEIQFENNDPIGKPYGGGSGYFPIILPEESDIIIADENFSNFKSTIESASYGDTIYVRDHLKIKIPSGDNLDIPDGVTLSSGRGRDGSQGALIYSDEIRTSGSSYNIISVGDDVEFTGLRIRGPDFDNGPISGNEAYGIIQERGKNLKVNNCELYYWPYAAILLYKSTGAIIKNNYIHDNQLPGLGYGIAHKYETNSIIEYNIFNNNRHSIAGSGNVNTSYTAMNNLVLPDGISHRFDMHGFYDLYDDDSGCENYWEPCNYAGYEINIINNKFIYECDSHQISVKVRGIPLSVANITNNHFSNDVPDAIRQLLKKDSIDEGGCPEPNTAVSWRNGPSTSNNCYYLGKLDVESNHMNVHSNTYNTTIYLRQINWGGDDQDFVIVAPEVMFDQSNSIEYDDFNNDGRTDILNEGYVSWSGMTEWELSTENYNINPNHFVDFNGDGLEDSFRIAHPSIVWPDKCFD